MKKETLIVGFFFVIVCGLLLVFAPDGLSRVFVIIQGILMLVGYIFGIMRVSRYSRSFQIARAIIHQTKKEIQADDMWVAISRNDNLFDLDVLDNEFKNYKNLVADRKKKSNQIMPDIEDTFNEDVISIKTWRSTVSQVPETLTGVGILGTFVGLLIGIGGIGLSSVAAAMSGLKILIDGIGVAFYTSIVGLILSICFNLTYKYFWNVLLKDMFLFIDDFHKDVIATEDSQLKELQVKYYTTMLKYYNDSEESGAKTTK